MSEGEESPEEATARLAQSAERKALNLVVVGSSPTVGVSHACVRVAVFRYGRGEGKGGASVLRGGGSQAVPLRDAREHSSMRQRSHSSVG